MVLLGSARRKRRVAAGAQFFAGGRLGGELHAFKQRRADARAWRGTRSPRHAHGQFAELRPGDAFTDVLVEQHAQAATESTVAAGANNDLRSFPAQRLRRSDHASPARWSHPVVLVH